MISLPPASPRAPELHAGRGSLGSRVGGQVGGRGANVEKRIADSLPFCRVCRADRAYGSGERFRTRYHRSRPRSARAWVRLKATSLPAWLRITSL